MTIITERIKEEIDSLLKEGLFLMREFKKANNTKFYAGYQMWYTRALSIISQLLVERLNEFNYLYDNRGVDSIVGLLVNPSLKSTFGDEVYGKFVQQYRIVESAQSRLDNTITNIQGLIQAEILDNEIMASIELSKSGHLRASGTLAGVVLERHLAKLCLSKNLKSNKKNPTIADWNEILKDANIYTVPTWRNIQYLADIRNYCTHPKDREPTKEEVDELIRGVQRITKTIF